MCSILHPDRGADCVSASNLGRLTPDTEDGEQTVTDIFVHQPVVVEDDFGGGRKMAIEKIDNVIRQALLGLAGEVSDVAKEDGDFQLALFGARARAELIEVENNNVLGTLQQPAHGYVSVDPGLAG